MGLEFISETLNQSIGIQTEFLVKSFVGIATVGTFAMALVQTIKTSPFRAFYFRLRLRRFLDEKDAGNVDDIENLICQYGAGGKREFYAQTLPEIVQGMASIKNLAIAWPDNEKFIDFLILFEQQAGKMLAQSNGGEKKKEVVAFLDQSITAQIEGFGIMVTHRWRFYQQLTAMVLSTGLIIIFAPINSPYVLFLYGILGGFIAPFAHDIINRIKAS